jgi:hypothetical protein
MRQLRIAVALVLTQMAVLFAAGPEEAVLSLDLGHPGPAISPYIYGQFIEHLGRCIHDGVWAEKLQDRKFLLARTGRRGRWSVLLARRSMPTWIRLGPTPASIA